TIKQKTPVGIFHRWWIVRTALFGSTIASDTAGDGITEEVPMMRTRNSSRTLEMRIAPVLGLSPTTVAEQRMAAITPSLS
ncbi:MAG: hypothetical protein ACKPKO_37800, partial [Candidatus Fonsibacter sp.]